VTQIHGEGGATYRRTHKRTAFTMPCNRDLSVTPFQKTVALIHHAGSRRAPRISPQDYLTSAIRNEACPPHADTKPA
jgi:hypothetical protein